MPTPAEVYDRLTPRLKRIAGSLAQRDTETDPDDIFQQMALVFWERSQNDPDFTQQQDAYICIVCAHGGGTHLLRKQRTYRRYVIPLDDPTPEEDDTAPTPEPTDPAPTPEAQVETRQFWASLAAAVRRLAPRDQTIVKMLYLGDRPVEIAAALQVDRRLIHKRQLVIRRALSDL